MAVSMEQNAFREMILSFRVSELQMLLGEFRRKVHNLNLNPLTFKGFAGRNKYGKKEELQSRALELVKIRSTPLQAKIRELYKSSQESQAAEMMGPNGQPINPYS